MVAAGTNGSFCQRTLASGAALSAETFNTSRETVAVASRSTDMSSCAQAGCQVDSKKTRAFVYCFASVRRLQMMEDMKTLSLGTWSLEMLSMSLKTKLQKFSPKFECKSWLEDVFNDSAPPIPCFSARLQLAFWPHAFSFFGFSPLFLC